MCELRARRPIEMFVKGELKGDLIWSYPHRRRGVTERPMASDYAFREYR